MAIPRSRAAVAAGVSAALLAAVAISMLGAAGAHAQPVPNDRPLHVTVGSTSLSPAPLFPTAHLRAAWTAHPTAALETPPIVLPNGQLFMTSSSGDAIVLDQEGATLTKFSTGARTASSATRLVDGTVLLVTATGEAIGIRAGQTRFRTRIFSEVHGAPSALALADGGAVLSSGTELVAIDGSGVARAHVALEESPAEPLVAVGDAVAAVGTSGAVFLWAPGSEPVSVGTFGERTEGVVAIGRTLTAICGGRLVDVDTAQKSKRPRVEPVHGTFVGQPMRIDGDVAALFRDGSHVELVQVARDGTERRRVAVAVVTAPTADAGAPSGASASSSPVARVRGSTSGVPSLPVSSNADLVNVGYAAVADEAGVVAFALPFGPIGVVARDGGVVTTSNPCSSGTATMAVAPRSVTTTLSPAIRIDAGASSAALVVSCSTGNLEELVSSQK